MKLSLRFSVLILSCASVVAAQTKPQETPPKTQESTKTQEAPKTQEVAKNQEASKTQETAATPATTQATPAGQAMVGAMVATGMATAVDRNVPVAGHRVASAKEVKNLYIEPMVHELDLYLRAEFAKKLAHRIVIVSKPEDADAVMTGIGEWHPGTEQTITERPRDENDTARGSVQVLSKGSLLWSSEAWGLLKSGNERKVADRVVHNFKNAIEAETEQNTNPI